MAASPMNRIEFEDGGVLEIRANQWVYARSVYSDAWRHTMVCFLSVGQTMRMEPAGPDRVIKAKTHLPYKNAQRKKK